MDMATDSAAATGPSQIRDEERLRVIRDTLTQMGATPEYCSRYFTVLGGVCEEQRCQSCVRHTQGVAQLPAGLMCRNAYEAYLGQLRGKFQLLRDEMVQHRLAWNRLRQEETACGFLNQDGQDAVVGGESKAVLKDKRVELEQLMLHNRGMGYRLKAERQALLANVRPVDAAIWHRDVTVLLDEEMDIRERAYMGRLVEAIPPRGRI